MEKIRSTRKGISKERALSIFGNGKQAKAITNHFDNGNFAINADGDFFLSEAGERWLNKRLTNTGIKTSLPKILALTTNGGQFDGEAWTLRPEATAAYGPTLNPPYQGAMTATGSAGRSWTIAVLLSEGLIEAADTASETAPKRVARKRATKRAPKR